MPYEKIDAIVTPVVGFIFFAVTACFIILTFILDHHWRAYTTSRMRLYSMRTAYLIVSGILIFVMLTSLPFLFGD